MIYFVLARVRGVLREAGWFGKRGLDVPNLAEWLDLVALGTVADVVPLDRNNRTLVHQGLMRMRRGRCRPGIQALAEVSQRSLPGLRASDLGFYIGPRLNAAGRLEDMSLGIRCLLADSWPRQGGTRLPWTNSTAPAGNCSGPWWPRPN